MRECRSLFMHAHMLPSIEKYMARYGICVDTIFLSFPMFFFIHVLKIYLVPCTNLIVYQVLSNSVKDLYT